VITAGLLAATLGAALSGHAEGDTHDNKLPLDWSINGYYRSRFVHISGLPIGELGRDQDLAGNADYLFMRFRLEPSLYYGPDPKKPIAALHVQVDALDNVLFGDNAKIVNTELFAENGSNTDINGEDVDTIELKRAWLEFLTPVGQMRVGRMASNWGLGLVANDGNGFDTPFGDPQRGSSVDRLLFATRPLTIANVLMGKDDRSTPLILVLAYDQLVEDPHTPLTDPPRSEVPFVPLSNADDDVNQFVAALVWKDDKLNRDSPTDELTAGFYFTHRWQSSTQSEVYIFDLYWKLKYAAFGADAPRLFTTGEVLTLQGASNALTDGIRHRPNIWSGVGRVGVEEDDWSVTLEGGYTSGDGNALGDDDFKMRPMHADYLVGLLLYPVILNARTANGAEHEALVSKGGVTNSTYFQPMFKYTVTDGISLTVAGLVAWADELTTPLERKHRPIGIPGVSEADFACTPFADSDCFLGWEVDAAVDIFWGDDDLMRWRLEGGVAGVGDALETKLTDHLVWTLQSRIAMVF